LVVTTDPRSDRAGNRNLCGPLFSWRRRAAAHYRDERCQQHVTDIFEHGFPLVAPSLRMALVTILPDFTP